MNENSKNSGVVSEEEQGISLMGGFRAVPVEKIPQREFHFKLGKETQELIALLAGVKPGQGFSLAAPNNLDQRNREVFLRRARDRLKIAIKHVAGEWSVVRRQHEYFAFRQPEAHYYGQEEEPRYTVE